MRTKALVLFGVIGSLGLAAATAQSVYSVNAVGYVNVTLRTGYNLISVPLIGTNNNVNTVIPVAPNDSVLFRWSNANQGFLPADTYFDVGDPQVNGWYDSGLNRSSTVINPGEGFFIQNVGPQFQITFVGDVPQGSLTNRIGPNYGFYSHIVPQSIGLLSVGFPGFADMTYQTWDAVSQQYGQALTYFDVGDPQVNGFYDSGLNKVDPTPAVAQGFVIFNPGPANNWTRAFSVN
jgi:hypothetical protein